MQEIWKDIPNYEGYQVSNLGRVRTHNKTTYTKKHGIRHWKDRLLQPKGQTYKTGYRVDLWKDGKPKTLLVARLVAFTFCEEDINNNKLTVNHIDGNRFNNELGNLEIISLKSNIQHGFKTGLYKTQKKIKVMYKDCGAWIYFDSLSKASKGIGKSNGYLSSKIKKGIYEDDICIWEVVC